MKKVLLLSLSFGLALTFSSSLVNAADTDSTMVAPGLSVAPVIDGTIDAAWDAIPYTSMHNKLTDGALDEEDYTVKFKLGWKGTNLFVLIDVTDNAIVTNKDWANYKQDYTMFFMDLIPSDDSTDYKDLNSFYYRMNADGTSPIDGRFFNNWEAPKEGVVGVSKARTGGFVAEYSVDVTKFELKSLKAGDVIGFNIETGDNDDAAVQQRTSQYVWSKTSTGNDWSSPIGEVGYVTLGNAIGTGLLNAKKSSLSVYPNPAVNQFSIATAANSVNVYTLAGVLVRSFDNVAANKSLSVNGLKGMYLVKATLADGSISTQKLVIK